MAAGAGAALLAAALAASAGFLHVQRRVARAVDRLRDDHLRGTEPGARPPGPTSSVEEVVALGCRALPALVSELDPELSPYYLCRVADCLIEICDGEAPREVFDDDPGRRRESVERLRAWWAREGPRRHSWWRFWTSSCVQ